MQTYKNIDAYIKAQPKEVRPILEAMRALVVAAAPRATEVIKYVMPTYVGEKNLVHFAAMKHHLGFYPTPSAITHFATLLTAYDTSKGCIRFKYHEPLPRGLITKIVKFRVAEDKAGK